MCGEEPPGNESGRTGVVRRRTQSHQYCSAVAMASETIDRPGLPATYPIPIPLISARLISQNHCNGSPATLVSQSTLDRDIT